MKTFSIISQCLVILLSVLGIGVKAEVTCIGNEYEQQNPLSNVVLPAVQIDPATKIVRGQTVVLNAIATVDSQNGGYPFFVWCADAGTFTETQDSIDNDYATVQYTAPNDATINQVNMSVLVGDTLGYINVATVTLPVQSTTTSESDPALGDVKFTSVSPIAMPGIVLLNGQPIQATWSADGVSFNLYQATGTTKETFSQPVKLDIRDANGQEIYVGCFPFKDVCTQRWYTKSIIQLWKSSVIEGYNEGKSATFGTQNDTNRAEFIAALVRALEGNQPAALSADPFNDVSKDKWYAPYVEYAKNMKLIQGCDPTKNLFCPDKAITRAEALKILVLAYPHLKKLAEDYLRGKTPKKFYSDVKDKTQWYYPYIYAAQAVNVAQGYQEDGSFKPGETLKRSEMAQLICIAQFGVMACTDMGNEDKSLVLTISPYIAQLNQSTTFTVYGMKLSETMMLSVQDCSNVTRTSHTPDLQTYQCTPTTNGIKMVKVLDNMGKTLYNGTMKVEGVVAPITLPGDTSTPPTGTQPTDPIVPPTTTCTTPTVTTVSPVEAILNQDTTFTVSGSCLPDTLAFYIDECPNQVNLGGNGEQRQFRCTPSYKAGSHIGVVKTQTAGSTLLDFSINYIDRTATTETPTNTCTATVDNVSPVEATLNQDTTFTVNGSCLPDTLAFYIDECPNQVSLGGNGEQRQFRCTPSYKTGSHIGVVKTQTAGSTLLDFSVNYVDDSVTTETPVSCSPTVNNITPLTATLGQSSVFTVEGDCLPDTTAFYIDECSGQTSLGGTANQRQFRCTPSYKTGSHVGVVKSETGGMELRNFSVNYEWGTPDVNTVTPSTARLNQLTTFTITGSSLLSTTAAWIDGCSGLQMLNGDANSRTFQCTPTKSGSISIIVKDKSGGTELYNSKLTVQ